MSKETVVLDSRKLADFLGLCFLGDEDDFGVLVDTIGGCLEVTRQDGELIFSNTALIGDSTERVAVNLTDLALRVHLWMRALVNENPN